MSRTPKIGEILRGDDGVALVVAEGTTPAAGLVQVIAYEYGGEDFAETNPAIVAALPRTRVETWRSCTKAWREGEGVDDDYADSWWAPHGDGGRRITVVHYDGSAYQLGEDALAAEPLAAARESAGGGHDG